MHKRIFLRNNPNCLSEAQATIQTPATILAYADDLCIFGHTKEDIHHKLNEICKFVEWAGISFNLSKCGSLSAINNKGSMQNHFNPNSSLNLIPALKWEDHYKCLGIKSGRE